MGATVRGKGKIASETLQMGGDVVLSQPRQAPLSDRICF